MTKKWSQLSQLATLAFEQELGKLAEIREREAHVALQQQKLGAMNAKAVEDLSSPHPIHWQNGDFLWQTWVGENARALNLEQARVRALLEIHRPELKKAFGRKLVMEALAKGQTR